MCTHMRTLGMAQLAPAGWILPFTEIARRDHERACAPPPRPLPREAERRAVRLRGLPVGRGAALAGSASLRGLSSRAEATRKLRRGGVGESSSTTGSTLGLTRDEGGESTRFGFWMAGTTLRSEAQEETNLHDRP
jgi:hypothetical protein